MFSVKPKYLVNEKGRKTAAVLSMKEYRCLMQRLEDLEDALDLDRAVETAEGFREYTAIPVPAGGCASANIAFSIE